MKGSILNRHAPLKTYQVRNNYVPWLKEETVTQIKNRNTTKEEAIKNNDSKKLKKYKKLRNEIKKKLLLDKRDYYKNKLHSRDESVGSVWNYVNDYLNSSKKSFSNNPAFLTLNNKTYSTPRDIANVFNEIFINKVKKLTKKTSQTPKLNPKLRLQNWLRLRVNNIEEFKLKPINILKLREIMKKLKGNRSSGIDFIDRISIKLACP